MASKNTKPKRRRRGLSGEPSVIELTERDLNIIEFILKNKGHASTELLATIFWGSSDANQASRRLRKLLDSKLLSVTVIGSRLPNIYFVTQHGLEVFVAKRSTLGLIEADFSTATFRHKETKRRLLCWKEPENIKHKEEMKAMALPAEIPTTSISQWTTRCHPDHAKVLLAIVDGTFTGSLMKAVAQSFVKSLQRRGFLVLNGTGNGSEWSINLSVAQTFRFTSKETKQQLSMIMKMEGLEETRRTTSNQWRLDLEMIASRKKVETLTVASRATSEQGQPDVNTVVPERIEKPQTNMTIIDDEAQDTSGVCSLTDEQLEKQHTDLVDHIATTETNLKRMIDENQKVLKEITRRKARKRQALEEELEHVRTQQREIEEKLAKLDK